MKRIINDCELSYEMIGAGIPVVCLHGFFVDSTLMKDCLEKSFENHSNFKRIYIDLVGMGDTPSNDHIQSSDALLSLIVTFIKEILDETPFIIIGESFGGYLSLALIKYFESQILGLFLICPCIIGDKKARTLRKKTSTPLPTIHVSVDEKEAYTSFADMAVVLNEKTWERYCNEIWVGIKKADATFLSEFEKNYTLKQEQLFYKIAFSNPTVFLLGKQDHVVGFEDALSLRKNFPQGTFAILNNAGHNLQIEQPELFGCFFENFLQFFL